jgi:hypothetical protein
MSSIGVIFLANTIDVEMEMSQSEDNGVCVCVCVSAWARVWLPILARVSFLFPERELQ